MTVLFAWLAISGWASAALAIGVWAYERRAHEQTKADANAMVTQILTTQSPDPVYIPDEWIDR